MLKLAVLSILCMYAYAAYYEEIAAKTILEQNSDPHATWKAGYNEYLRGKDEAAIRRLMGTKMGKNPKSNVRHPMKHDVLAGLPTSFVSGKDKWSQCNTTINYIKDQADCGSCWAVAASEVVEDRVCIANMPSSSHNDLLNEPAPPVCFSAEDIMTCCRYCGDGCQGGYPIDAMKWWAQTGVVTGCWYGSKCGCQPYQIPPCGPQGCSAPEARTPKCSTTCRSGYPVQYAQDKHMATKYYQIAGNAAAIQTEIYNNGPVECAFNVYENFMNYKSGVYNRISGQLLGGHAVKIIGWGVSGSTPYWIINNSWNTTWGMNGQVLYLRGKDLAGMESQCVAGMAKTSDSNYQLQC
jgi:cathepsin B